MDDITRRLIKEGEITQAKYGTEICPQCGLLRPKNFCFTCWNNALMKEMEKREEWIHQ
ncbi:hypothetical protein LCGC14_0845770 [marine sediment metagenome]|uniref:Uncharacterized protein n=1 Tax=marine sediment metagenome TaxID=412755 RepID=A0A0F9RWJ8_9ZZZZ